MPLPGCSPSHRIESRHENNFHDPDCGQLLPLKCFRKAAFYSAVQEAVQKCVPEHPSVDAAGAKSVDAPSFTVPMVEFVKHEDEKNYLDDIRMEERFLKLAEAVEKRRVGVENGVLTKK